MADAASTVFDEQEDDELFTLFGNTEWEQILVDLNDPLWKVQWEVAACFRPIVTTACRAPPGFKCTEFDAVRLNDDGSVAYRRHFRSGDIIRIGRQHHHLHALHLAHLPEASRGFTAAGGHIDVLPLCMKGRHAKDKVVAFDDKQVQDTNSTAYKSPFQVKKLDKVVAHYSLKTLHGHDPRTKFPITQLDVETKYIAAMNVVLATVKELDHLRDTHKLFKNMSLQDLAKWSGSPFALKLGMMLSNASDDIAAFERSKLSGVFASAPHHSTLHTID